jgi:Uma2 family endonuclease
VGMAEPARRLATYEDILALPEHITGEIIAGELYTSPRPAGRHTFVASELGGELVPPFGRGRGGPGGWYILHEPELHLGDDVLVPDLAGWKRERLPLEARTGAYFTIVPDWVCEVFSPWTTKRDREIKAPTYARHGVQHLWLVDPVAGHVDAYSRREDGWLWLGSWSDNDARIPPFDAIGIELQTIWEIIGGPKSEL